MKKLIVFDVDGTLFDTKNGIIAALNCVLSQYGEKKIPVNEQDKYIGPAVRDSLMEYNGFSIDKAEKAANIYRDIYVKKYISKSVPYPCLNEVLIELRNRGFILGIATMKTNRQVEKLLEMFNLTDVFQYIMAARDDGALTKEQMLIHICDYFKVGHQFVYMVGDTQGDYDAARNFGCYFIAADYGYGHIEEVEGVKHINTLYDVLKILI